MAQKLTLFHTHVLLLLISCFDTLKHWRIQNIQLLAQDKVIIIFWATNLLVSHVCWLNQVFRVTFLHILACYIHWSVISCWQSLTGCLSLENDTNAEKKKERCSRAFWSSETGDISSHFPVSSLGNAYSFKISVSVC